MIQLDASSLALRLEARYGLGLSGGTQVVEGGTFAAIRPNDLERPNGFAIVVARTPRIVEASLRLDGFTRRLLRQMSEADDLQRSTFAMLAEHAEADGFRIGVSVNENHIGNLAELPYGEWVKLEVDCDHRLPSGKISEKVQHDCALEVASICLGLVLSLLPVEEVTDSVSGFEPGLPEGAKIRVEVNRYERSPVNRAACISHYGTKCQVCDFDFRGKYGALGNEYIEVHHRVPVSAMGGAYRLDPVRDLVPVCSNCHAMLHRAQPPLTVEGLRKIIGIQVGNSTDNAD
jgi:5-methylcytosine-specific restriction enzyme A